jgi:Domain of unknown function (DUF4845)
LVVEVKTNKFIAAGSFANERQAGMSLLGLILVLGIGFSVILLGMKMFPAFTEYSSVKKAIVKVKGSVSTPAEASAAFDRAAQVDDITSIVGKDLTIVKGNGGELEISFAYAKKLELFGPASLLLEFQGSTKK